MPHPVLITGAGPGDPDLLTLGAARALAEAEIVLHDALVSPAILALTQPQASLIPVGKTGFGPSMAQPEINARLIAAARTGARVVRLKSGDPGVFGRLDEELDALDAAGLPWRILPGLTAASAAAAALGQSLTRRGRNSDLRIVTGHDMQGFADQDWAALARPGTVAAIYMGKRAARFLQGRLMMHGAAPGTPVTAVFNASRPDQALVPATLGTLPAALQGQDGPAVLLYGLSPRAVARALPDLPAKAL